MLLYLMFVTLANNVNKTKFLQDQNNKTKTTRSKQRHFADLTFK